MILMTNNLTAEKDGISKETEIGFNMMAKAANKVFLELELETALKNKDCNQLNAIGNEFFTQQKYVDQNVEIALRAFQNSLDLGNKDAIFYLADLYQLHSTKLGIAMETILHNLEQAIELGYADAMFYMGWRYKMGDGVEQNSNKSLYWFEKALIHDAVNIKKYLKEVMGLDDYDEFKSDYEYEFDHDELKVA